MNFAKRLRFYLIGISLGILVVAIFFGPRAFTCSYFPNARTLEEFRTKPMRISPVAKKQLNELGIDSVFLFKKVLTESKITNFNSDEMRSRPYRIYRAIYKDDTLQLNIKFKLNKRDGILDELVKK